MGKQLIVALVLCAFFYQFSFASDESKNCASLIEQINALDPAKGQGWRGFLSPRPSFSAEAGQLAADKNIMFWGQRIYIAPSIDGIVAHDVLQPNIMLKGVYVIIDKPSSDPIELKKQVQVALLENKIYWVDYKADLTELVGEYSSLKNEEVLALREKLTSLSEVKMLDPEFVKNNFDPQKIESTFEVARNAHFFILKGWFAPRYRGMLLTSALDTSHSHTYKNLFALARSLYKKGFTFTFNKDFEGAIKLLANQERFEKNLLTGERFTTDPSTNRYKDKTFTDGEIDRFKKGHAFSVEVWSPDGKLVAGAVGHRSGNILSPDSIFYDKSVHKSAYDMAKISVIALMERAADAGLPFVDAGMVTNFTASMKGKYVPREKYVELVNKIPKDEVFVDLHTPWIPH